MLKRLLASRLERLTAGDWISIRGREHPVRTEAVYQQLRILDASVFEDGLPRFERFNFSQVTDLHTGGEAAALDKIIANSRR